MRGGSSVWHINVEFSVELPMEHAHHAWLYLVIVIRQWDYSHNMFVAIANISIAAFNQTNKSKSLIQLGMSRRYPLKWFGNWKDNNELGMHFGDPISSYTIYVKCEILIF